MHGIKRSRLSAQAQEARKQEEAQTIGIYRDLVTQCLDLKSKCDHSQDAFDLTTKVLEINPEFYTIWNYRRTILLKGKLGNISPEERYDLLKQDLAFTTAHLKTHPKVYWIWTHRKWLLEQTPGGPGDTNDWKKKAWNTELLLVERMLEADARNFHAWDYRRYIIASSPSHTVSDKQSLEAELKYTKKKIESNFSNFSAWHQRTKVLPTLWRSMSPEQVGTSKEQEFELVTQALWTDPADQSGWLYHRWLIGDGQDEEVLVREIDQIEQLVEAEPEAKWPLESLVHYSTLRLQHSLEVSTRARIKSQAIDRLVILERIDPPRRQRYLELRNQFAE